MKNIFKKVTLFVAMIMAVCAISVVTSTEAKAAYDFSIRQIDATESSLKIVWNAVPGAARYKVYMGGLTGYVTGPGAVAGNLQSGRKYLVYVTALDYSGYSMGTSDTVYCYTKPKVGQIQLYDWKQGTTTPTIKWQNNNYTWPDGYEVCLMNAKGKTVKTITTGSSAYSNFKLPGGSSVKNKGFSVKVRAFYLLSNGTKFYGDWSAEERMAAMPKPKFSKATKKISWPKVSGAKSYTVYRKKPSSSKFTKYKTTKSTSIVIDQPYDYSTYKYYVVANDVKVHGKKIKSTIPTSGVYTLNIWFYRSYRY